MNTMCMSITYSYLYIYMYTIDNRFVVVLLPQAKDKINIEGIKQSFHFSNAFLPNDSFCGAIFFRFAKHTKSTSNN